MDATDLSIYPHTISIPIRFMDLDTLQHVNNVRYLNFLEEARIGYSQQLLNKFYNIKDINVLVARIEIDYFRPILYNQAVKVYTRIAKLGSKSFVFDSLITSHDGQNTIIAAQAKQVMVMFDLASQKSIPISDELKQKVYSFEPHLKK